MTTISVTWSWKYLVSLQILSLTIRNIEARSEKEGRLFGLKIEDGELVCIPAGDKDQDFLCLLSESIRIHSPVVNCLKIKLDINPSRQFIDERAIVISWRNVCVTYTNECANDIDLPGSNINCLNCGKSLNAAATNKPKKVLQLPSDYWSELVDCWSCHKQEFAGVTKDLMEQRYLLPKCESYIHYLPHNYFIFSVSAVQNVLSIDAMSKQVKCGSCRFVVGYSLDNTSRGHAVLVPLSRTTSTPGLSKYISRRILEAMQAHSTFHFIINNSLTIQLVNWTCRLSEPCSNELSPVIIVKVVTYDQTSRTYSADSIQIFDDELAELKALLARQVLEGEMSYLLY